MTHARSYCPGQLQLSLFDGNTPLPLTISPKKNKDHKNGVENARCFARTTVDFWIGELAHKPALAAPIGEGKRRSEGRTFRVEMAPFGNCHATAAEAILACAATVSAVHSARLANFCAWLGEKGVHTATSEIAIGVQVYRGVEGWYAAPSRSL